MINNTIMNMTNKINENPSFSILTSLGIATNLYQEGYRNINDFIRKVLQEAKELNIYDDVKLIIDRVLEGIEHEAISQANS